MKNGISLVACLLVAAITAPPAPAATQIITQSGLTWSPDLVVINVGDTVQWVWASFSHTVTNGLDLTDPAVGTLFDAPLNSLNRTFTHTFTTPGTVPFFCRPHLVMGMTGTIIVQAAASADQVPAHSALGLTSAPNPFNPRAVISYTLPTAAEVRLSVFDAAGHRLRVLSDGAAQDAGRQETTWDGLADDGRAAAAGVYVVTVEAAGSRESIKLTLAK